MTEKMNAIVNNFNGQDKKKIDDFLSIMADIGLKDDFVLSGLMYFSLRAKNVSLEEIRSECTPSTLKMVETLVKLDNINFSLQNTEAENLRKMFFAITKDIRTIMLKIAIVVADVRNLGDSPNEQKHDFARVIFSLYAPLAARLGLSAYKTELEEAAFKIEHPKLQAEIQAEVDNRYHHRAPIVERLKALVNNCMHELGIKGRVYGRKKHIYSIYKKLQDHSFDNIYDLIAVRAIVGTVAECYALLGRLHCEVEPLQNRFKDYIATPKPNGYQSLHTTVIFEGFPVEIQIRTEDMNKYAEYGVAAYWLYKEKGRKRDTLDASLGYLRLMMDSENVSIDELADSLNQDIYNNEIFVQTPKGKVIYLPSQSTPIDFAYCIHSEVGNRCVGAKVNGKMVPTTTPLNNGDVVEIITNPNSKGPSRDWLKTCKTAGAKKEINLFFKRNMKEENIRLGKSMLENAIKEKGYSVAKLTEKKNLDEVLPQYNLNNLDELYASLGTNAYPIKAVVNKLVSLYQKQIKTETLTATTPENNVRLAAPSEKLIAVKGLNNILMRFANCCHPMYGDKIVGFISAGRGIIIHRAVCPNVSYFDSSRLIEADWKPNTEVNGRKKKSKEERNEKNR